MKDVGKNSFESSQEGPEEGEEETPKGEIIIPIGPVNDWCIRLEIILYQVIGIGKTYAKATPSITGIKLRILRVLYVLPNIIADSMRVKIGVAARTTWWN